MLTRNGTLRNQRLLVGTPPATVTPAKAGVQASAAPGANSRAQAPAPEPTTTVR